MSDIKLPKLPDRTPVKITITASVELNESLREYADIYMATYGVSESIAELIPFMLTAFIESDIAFKKVRRGKRMST
jgi:hypothetical protein